MEKMFYLAVTAALAAIFTAVSIPQIVKISRQKYLFDVPNARKASLVATPTLGGIGIFFGFIISITLSSSHIHFTDFKCIITGLIIILFTGLMDDLVNLSPKNKLFLMISAISIVVFLGDVQFSHMYGLFGLDHIPEIYAGIFSIIIGIAIINAMNLIDGIDGLSASITIQIALILGIWFAINGYIEYALFAFALIGSTLAFFVYNVFGKRNKLFMGDTGSLLIGTILFILASKFNELNLAAGTTHAIQAAPAVLIGIFAFPVFDVIRVSLIRIFVLRKSPFSPDKHHIHHRLLSMGFSHINSTIIISATNLLFVLAAFSLHNQVSTTALFFIIGGLAFLVVFTLEFYLIKKKIVNYVNGEKQIIITKQFVRKIA